MLPAPVKRLVRGVAPGLFFSMREKHRSYLQARRATRHHQMKLSQMRMLIQLAAGRVAVDVGAHKGLYALELVKVARRLIAFEPNPILAAGLRDLMIGAPCPVEVRHVALSDHVGKATLRVPVQRPGSATLDSDNLHVNQLQRTEAVEEVDVELVTLDSLELRGIDVMKIDVEGHQLPLIQGARETLMREKPDIMVEIDESHRAGSIGQVVAALRELGFVGYFALGETLMPESLFRLEVFHRRENSREGKVRINDFFFFHEDNLENARQRLANVVFYPADDRRHS